ncbi:DUF4198 domain-containing protein [Undibacterium parvum]|uniref:DUF4198 domain-containing protein n=1 Tax=Undibacterium parvum TaxID=401471 RepID=A0A3Q9BR79_9BURK|nr:DUF4198 domain-containing protein [Undibacterium parvum]AZP11812.1 DUF4198 domain-containing protein [Undibacterium parvum]
MKNLPIRSFAPRFSLHLLLCAALITPLAAQAHRTFLLPSATVVAGNTPWVSFDAAAATDLFYFDHVPLQLDSLVIATPDGSAAKAENASTGKYRSSFDLRLSQKGTYKLSLLNQNLFANYKEQGVAKRWRGTAEAMAKEIPANAEELQVTQMQGRIETFVSNGKPGKKALEVTGKGLELDPITHPNDLMAGEAAQFRLLLDGKPAVAVKVTVIAGGIRYRQNLGEQIISTDADGKFSVNWQGAGMYWMEASVSDKNTTLPAAKERRANYVATLEVLPQ